MKNDIIVNEIDQLGMILAEIADLEKKAERIKNDLKDRATLHGGNVFEGEAFKATVIASNRTTTDWKSLAADLGISADLIAKYGKTSAVFSVKLTSR